MDCIVPGVTKSRTRLSDFHFHSIDTYTGQYIGLHGCHGVPKQMVNQIKLHFSHYSLKVGSPRNDGIALLYQDMQGTRVLLSYCSVVPRIESLSPWSNMTCHQIRVPSSRQKRRQIQSLCRYILSIECIHFPHVPLTRYIFTVSRMGNRSMYSVAGSMFPAEMWESQLQGKAIWGEQLSAFVVSIFNQISCLDLVQLSMCYNL